MAAELERTTNLALSMSSLHWTPAKSAQMAVK
jgi:hypothetical protein